MCVTIIDGRTGSGKSTLAAQLGYYCAKGNMTLKHEAFTGHQFVKGLNELQKGQSLILDEAFELLNKRKTQSLQNMINISMLQQARMKQGFIFIVIPSCYDLDKNIILNLADLFIHCYRKPFGRRGQFVCFDRQRLKNLWLYCRQSYSYSPKVATPNFFGRFVKFFPFDFEEYEQRKMKALEQMKDNKTLFEDKVMVQRNDAIFRLKKEGKSIQYLCDLFGLKERMIFNILREQNKEIKIDR